MLHIIVGSDKEKMRTQFQKLRRDFRGVCGDERVVLEDEVAGGLLDTLGQSQGLFGGTTLVVMDQVLDKKEAQKIFLAHLETLVQSKNIFLVIESAFDKGSLGLVREKVEHFFEYLAKKADYRPAFNIFSLGDALGARNKKDLWVLYQQAVSAGLSSEEIQGTLFWQVKNMALMKSGSPKGDCGLSPFVAQKAKKFCMNYTKEEIMNLAHGLTRIFHEDRRGGEPMLTAIEKFILAL